MQVLRQDVYFAMYIAHCMQMTTRLAHSCLVVALINPICVKHMTISQLHHTQQWSFRRTGTMGTLASLAESGVWVQASGGDAEDGCGREFQGYYPRKKILRFQLHHPAV